MTLLNSKVIGVRYSKHPLFNQYKREFNHVLTTAIVPSSNTGVLCEIFGLSVNTKKKSLVYIMIRILLSYMYKHKLFDRMSIFPKCITLVCILLVLIYIFKMNERKH